MDFPIKNGDSPLLSSPEGIHFDILIVSLDGEAKLPVRPQYSSDLWAGKQFHPQQMAAENAGAPMGPPIDGSLLDICSHPSFGETIISVRTHKPWGNVWKCQSQGWFICIHRDLMGPYSSMIIGDLWWYPLVNIQKTDGKITMLFMGKSTINGHFH